MLRAIHPIAGIVGFLTILVFWTSTLFSELFTPHATVAVVKSMIVSGLFILVPAMAIVGASGMSLGRRRKDAPALAKKKRMPIIAINGLFILVPAAIYLSAKANAGSFDTSFYVVQVVELIAGATNLTLMGLSIRDGRAMTARRRAARKSDPAAR
ncbi:hypothetical protein SAMN05444358_1011830 [Ruegeria halocynthiae]|uniref:Transmembrane protein n=1 Tax=Ruegeria halocynthiae TaxID=985054 RepID=A0A1H2WMV0_9RHOB|nr:hypothetical protein [Ruegeria halocynthiae]SDW81319.1 hypothetical protein SAMN05444358_1011830 [Ruegeria halocynthiae]